MNPKSYNNSDFHTRRNAEAAIAVIKKDYIPFLAGRPNRETVIGADDILNLKIALETAKSFSAFLEMV